MKIFLTGASGFVGSSVLKRAIDAGHDVVALVNKGKLAVESPRISIARGDIFDEAFLRDRIGGCDAVIHLVGIIAERPKAGITFRRMHFEATRSMVNAAESAGVKRYVQMSALGTRPRAVAEYHKTKWLAEEYLRGSGLNYTIIRPSMIHGPRGEFMRMVASWARGKSMPYLFMPYFGAGLFGMSGAGRLQAVYVEDVARAFVDCIENNQTVAQTYDLGGHDVLTWRELYRAVSTRLNGKPARVIPIPVWYGKLLCLLTPGSWLPFNLSQIQMAEEDNTADNAPFVRDFGFDPRGFEPTFADYANQL